MSQAHDIQEIPKHIEAGRLLSKRLRIARKMSGALVCPSCAAHFDATHLIRCPECRSFIDGGFRSLSPGKTEKKASRDTTQGRGKALRKSRRSRRVKEKAELELDFFSQGYMEYKG